MLGARRDRRILVTLPDTPWPVNGGKRLRCNGVLRGLAAAGRVDVAVLFSSPTPGHPPVPPDLEVEDWMSVGPTPRSRLVGAAVSLARGMPVHVGAQRWNLVRQQMAAWAERQYDLVWFGGLDHAMGLRGTLTARRRVVDCDDVETVKWRAFLDSGAGDRLERVQRRVELPLWARIQADVSSWADAVAVCSDVDVHRFGAARAFVVPNTYPEPVAPTGDVPVVPLAGEAQLVMIANWGTDQNVDAARYAVHEVLPKVRRLLPGARLRLVGRLPERINQLAGIEGVDLVGPVDEVRAELAAAHVVVVPMRFGGGTRLKVLEAFAHRAPVVSTTLGAEGLPVRDGVHLLLRDRPEDFAAAVRAVVTDTALRARMVDAGHALYHECFRPQAAVSAVTALVDRLLP